MLIGGANLKKNLLVSDNSERAATSVVLTGSNVTGRKSKTSSSNLSREFLGALFLILASSFHPTSLAS